MNPTPTDNAGTGPATRRWRAQFGAMRLVPFLPDLAMQPGVPPQMAVMVRRIGYRAALVLCEQVPGQTIRRADPVHYTKVAALIGTENVGRLLGDGYEFRVPLAYGAVVRAKLVTLVEWLRAGSIDVQTACEKYGLTSVQLHQVRQALDDRRPIERLFPHPDELPIPDGVAVGPDWPEQLVELADHIGASATLRVVVALGGEELYIPRDAGRSLLRGTLRPSEIATFHEVYGGVRFRVPVAAGVLRAARRAGIIASVRAGLMTVNDATRLLRTSRTYMSHLVNHTTEGVGVAPIGVPVPRIVRVLKDAATIAERRLQAAGIDAAAIEATRSDILNLAFDEPHSPNRETRP